MLFAKEAIRWSEFQKGENLLLADLFDDEVYQVNCTENEDESEEEKCYESEMSLLGMWERDFR